MSRCYVCWKLDENQRETLLRTLLTHFPVQVADHVTLQYDVPSLTPLPPEAHGIIVGEIIDRGVQAYVVSVNGTTRRPDGERYHITWSLEEDRYPSEALHLVRRGWFPLENPIPIILIPYKVII